MVVKQAFNSKTKAWVKGEVKMNKKTGGKFVKWTDVKQKNPSKPFKNTDFF